VKTINLNPSIAWKASETLSLGAGMSIQYAEATLTNSAGGAGLATVKGDDYGWGFNLGALWQVSEATRVGLAYRSEVEHTLGGDVGFSAAAMLNGPVNADVTLPDSASLSLFHKLDSRWDLLADITWTGWSDFRNCASYAPAAMLGTPPRKLGRQLSVFAGRGYPQRQTDPARRCCLRRNTRVRCLSHRTHSG
jgi:long-subunit fatty acid transport protein